MKPADDFSWTKLGGVVSIALCLYIGAYAALCEPKPSRWGFFAEGNALFAVNASSTTLIDPTYKLGGSASAYFFWPAHKLDQMLFPKRWKASPYL